jgi:Ser/Thr protein kinase RdoA (MazF antagonist)
LARSLGDLVARGTRSTVYAYGRDAVVKVPVPSTPEEWIRYEARYAEAARVCGAAAPRLLGIERIDGRAASVWERVDGVSMWEQVVDQPGRSAELGRLLADVQLGLFDLVPPVTLPSQRDRLATKIRRAAATIDAGLERALDLLPPASRSPRICHGDLHPSNVLMSARGPMVIDWFDAARGDAIADVARSSLMLLGNETEPPAHLPGAELATLATLISAYRGRLGERGLALDVAELALWQALNAVARLAEGVPPGPLVEVWASFERARGAYAVAN